MITKEIFAAYKLFREQAACPFCKLPNVASVDGLYWCALDKSMNPIAQVGKSFFRKPHYWMFYCETCGRYFLTSKSEGRIINDNFFNDIVNSTLIEDVSPSDAVKILAEKAYGSFCEYYKTSSMLKNLVKQYAIYRIQADMRTLIGSERIKDIELPLNVAHDKLNDFIFTGIKKSVLVKFPRRAYYQKKAEQLFGNDSDSYHNELMEVILDKLLVGFLFDFFYLLKDECEIYLRDHYVFEANYILNNQEVTDGYFNELYGRCIQIIVDAMQSLGLNIPIIEMEKIIYGNLIIRMSEDTSLSIMHNIIMCNLSINNREEVAGGMKKLNIDRNNVKRDMNLDVTEKNLKDIDVAITNSTIGGDFNIRLGETENDDFEKAINVIKNSTLDKQAIDVLVKIMNDAQASIKENCTVEQEKVKRRFEDIITSLGDKVKPILQTLAPIATISIFS